MTRQTSRKVELPNPNRGNSGWARAYFFLSFLLCVCVCWREGSISSVPSPHILLTVKLLCSRYLTNTPKKWDKLVVVGIDIYTLPRVKWIASGKLLHNTGSSAWSPMMVRWGRQGGEGPRGRRRMYAYSCFTTLCSRN